MKHRWIVDFLDCNGVVLPQHSQRFYTRLFAQRFAKEMQPDTETAAFLNRFRVSVPLYSVRVKKL